MARSATVPVDSITVGKRHRKDMGDLQPLANSIDAEGLLHPIGITQDTELVFGERRLHAVQDILGWDRIEAKVVNVSSIAAGEYAENELRKDFSTSERVEIGRTIEAEIGNRQGERTDLGDEAGDDRELPQNLAEVLPGKETRDIAAEKAGFGNRETYRQAAKVVDKGTPELVKAMDDGLAPSTAAKLAELPKSEQKKAVKGGKGAIKEALAPPKPAKTFPASDTFMAWMASLSGVRTKIKQDYGSFKKMIAHKGWEKARTPAALDLLKRVRDGLDTLYKEATKP